MKPQPPPNNGNGANAQAEQSDLEAILQRVAPEHRADFLRLRQKLQRHDDNDELLAVLRYLDTAVMLMDLTARQAQPEEIKKALAAVEKSSKDQAAAVARYPRWNYALNASTQVITAVLGAIIGAGLVGALWYFMHDAQTKTAEYCLARDMKIIHGGLDYSTSDNGHVITLKVWNPAKLNPGQTPWVVLRPVADDAGNAVVTLIDPTPPAKHQ